ncbi:uncharacterized protein LOC130649587 isoform X2 [Hydractinia symbiolongicarpus]|uniref:uncharacterized protein LOC130649587 isoform X2 n=1 Tax=Hydractinia symbiolongicarpus TaxID=13093 RepID=UPI002551B406|nr:uncharacterized protein LOC130649587 isoform X2 [Hydractinia symbiolongicarpus]
MCAHVQNLPTSFFMLDSKKPVPTPRENHEEAIECSNTYLSIQRPVPAPRRAKTIKESTREKDFEMFDWQPTPRPRATTDSNLTRQEGPELTFLMHVHAEKEGLEAEANAYSLDPTECCHSEVASTCNFESTFSSLCTNYSTLSSMKPFLKSKRPDNCPTQLKKKIYECEEKSKMMTTQLRKLTKNRKDQKEEKVYLVS